jgi:hypothetical protein
MKLSRKRLNHMGGSRFFTKKLSRAGEQAKSIRDRKTNIGKESKNKSQQNTNKKLEDLGLTEDENNAINDLTRNYKEFISVPVIPYYNFIIEKYSGSKAKVQKKKKNTNVWCINFYNLFISKNAIDNYWKDLLNKDNKIIKFITDDIDFISDKNVLKNCYNSEAFFMNQTDEITIKVKEIFKTHHSYVKNIDTYFDKEWNMYELFYNVTDVENYMDYIIFIYEIQQVVKVESGNVAAELDLFFTRISDSDAGFKLALKLHLKSLELQIKFFGNYDSSSEIKDTSRKVSWKDVIKQEIYNPPPGALYYRLISKTTKNDPIMPINPDEQAKVVKAAGTQNIIIDDAATAISQFQQQQENLSDSTKQLLKRNSANPMEELSDELEEMKLLEKSDRFSMNIVYNINKDTATNDLSKKIKTEHLKFFMSGTLRQELKTSNIYGKYNLDVIENLIIPGFNGWCLLPCDSFKNVSYSSMVLSYETAKDKISRVGFTIDKKKKRKRMD